MMEGLVRRARNPEKRAEYEAELACPPFPQGLMHVWHAFCRLNARRGSNGFAINPISWSEIDAYIRRSGLRLAPWEIRLLEELDDLFVAQAARPKD